MSIPNENNPAEEARYEAAETLTDLLKKAAKAIEAERTELQENFPAMASLPDPINVDPNVITDFTQSEAYKKALEDYVVGRCEQNIIVTVVQLLRGLIPTVFGGI